MPEQPPMPYSPQTVAAMRASLADLLEWAARMGGFEAPEWDAARATLDGARYEETVPAANPTGHKSLLAQFAALKDAGLTFADCVAAFGVARDGDPYASAAHALYADDDLEVDDLCVLSEADDGAWVSCWRWITNTEAGVTTERKGD